MNKYLWNPTQGMFYDYDFTTQKQSTYNYISAFYPLWAKLATPKQAAAVQRHLSLFEHDGGLAMSDTNSGTQWDLPFGWAPTNWLAIDGLAQYGFSADASRISKKFSQTILQNFLTDATIREKYNVVSGSANVAVATGYKSNVVGFGWTNGVYLQMHALLTHRSKQAAAANKATKPATATAPSPADAAVPVQSRMQSHSAPRASDYPPPSISRSAFPSLLHQRLSSPAP
jgi:alpha,alpha-trehalase